VCECTCVIFDVTTLLQRTASELYGESAGPRVALPDWLISPEHTESASDSNTQDSQLIQQLSALEAQYSYSFTSAYSQLIGAAANSAVSDAPTSDENACLIFDHSEPSPGHAAESAAVASGHRLVLSSQSDHDAVQTHSSNEQQLYGDALQRSQLYALLREVCISPMMEADACSHTSCVDLQLYGLSRPHIGNQVYHCHDVVCRQSSVKHGHGSWLHRQS
jgi:hypothetical protein